MRFLLKATLLTLTISCLYAYTEQPQTDERIIFEYGTNNSANYSKAEALAIYKLFKEVTPLIPESIKRGVNTKILVEFDLEDKLDITHNLCHKNDDELSKKMVIEPRAKLVEGEIRGSAEIGYEAHISLNKQFLEIIVAGEENAPSYNCGHKNLYKLAKALLIEGTAKVFDRTYNKSRSTFPAAKNFSKNRQYYSLAGFKNPNTSSNQLQLRSPDVREFISSHDHFGINLALFLLDHEFACRRPAVNYYFETRLGHKPQFDEACELNDLIKVGDKQRPLNLNPERVYQVRDMMVDGGKGFIGSWGHSLTAIILCKEGVPLGEECLDLDHSAHHVVASYRANVDDFTLNTLKGLGIQKEVYNSQLFILSKKHLIDKNNVNELRDMFSLPMDLDEEEKNFFVYTTLERYWGYAGHYKFATNHCGTEARRQMEASVDSDQRTRTRLKNPFNIKKTPLGLSTPISIHNAYDKFGLIDMGLVEYKTQAEREALIQRGRDNRREQYFYPANIKVQKMALEIIVKHIPDFLGKKSKKITDKKVMKFFRNVSMHPAERLIAYNEAAKRIKDPKERGRFLFSAKKIETQMKFFFNQGVEKRAGQIFDAVTKGKKLPDSIIQAFDSENAFTDEMYASLGEETLKKARAFSPDDLYRYKEVKERLKPWRAIKTGEDGHPIGYGIPLYPELKGHYVQGEEQPQYEGELTVDQMSGEELGKEMERIREGLVAWNRAKFINSFYYLNLIELNLDKIKDGMSDNFAGREINLLEDVEIQSREDIKINAIKLIANDYIEEISEKVIEDVVDKHFKNDIEFSEDQKEIEVQKIDSVYEEAVNELVDEVSRETQENKSIKRFKNELGKRLEKKMLEKLQ